MPLLSQSDRRRKASNSRARDKNMEPLAADFWLGIAHFDECMLGGSSAVMVRGPDGRLSVPAVDPTILYK
jgi:hypothetical protein